MSKRIIVLPEELEIIENRLSQIEKVLKKEQKQIEDPILSTGDVLKLLKVSPRSLQTWRDEALIEFSAVKSKFYYRLSAIYKMLDNHLQKEGGGYGKKELR